MGDDFALGSTAGHDRMRGLSLSSQRAGTYLTGVIPCDWTVQAARDGLHGSAMGTGPAPWSA